MGLYPDLLGRKQWPVVSGVQDPDNYDETFRLVVKLTTVRTVLSLAICHTWPIHQLDVKNVLLHGTLSETVYCSQPIGFVDPMQPDRVCHLN
jgi:hypothetical protein